MKKFMYEHADNKIKCEAAQLDLRELVAEVCILVNNLYSSLERQEPEAAELFKKMVMFGFLPGTPVWDVSEISEGGICTMIMTTKE